MAIIGLVDDATSQVADYVDQDIKTTGTPSFASVSVPSDSAGLNLGAGTDASLVYDGTDCKLTTDLVGASDFVVDCGTAKTLKLAESVYDDIQFPISTGKAPASNAPDFDAFTTNTSAFSFEVNDYIDLQSNELYHGWKEGTTGYFHLHFALAAAQSSGSSQYAKFTIYIAMKNTSTGVYEESSVDVEAEIPDGSADRLSFFLQDATGTTLTNHTIGDQILVRVKRIAATTGTEYGGEVFLLQCGLHVEKDTIGSRSVSSK